jgi:2-furoyl-CoA dehydrogenase large subunit
VPRPTEQVFAMLLDPAVLRIIIPGCHALDVTGAHAYRADVSLGAGPVRGRFEADVRLRDLDPPCGATLEGRVTGALGTAHGTGRIRLRAVPGGTRADYDYAIAISGKVASVGSRMLDGAARAVISLFFRQLIAATGRPAAAPWWRRLLRRKSG